MKIKDILQEFYAGNITDKKAEYLIKEIIKHKVAVGIFKHATKNKITIDK